MHDAIKGLNSTVLAYGQTGSGKTYTMYGKDCINILKNLKTDPDSIEHAGIIPRVAIQLFQDVKQKTQNPEEEVEFQINL